MKKLLLLLLFIPLVSFGQIKNAENNLESNEKIKYYNKDWISVNKSKAKYYRIYSIDSDGKISNVRDYFSNGNIQGTADGASFISDNDKFSKWTGNVKIYNEKGRLTSSYYSPLFDWEDEISIKEYFDKNNSKNLEGIWELSTRNGNIKMVVYYNELLKNYNFISLPPFQGALSGSIESSSREGLFSYY